eukprot:TRINITY_DN11376_c0_g1_i2.p1 TRINITY_DN11376_c0_g1~~TRINITY_DN11376_c0_g1_i2.p1  ORF type:complete len:120 (+),score=3.90 TRINITY_DN11376_c0_g1_i2:299-658(+)
MSSASTLLCFFSSATSLALGIVKGYSVARCTRKREPILSASLTAAFFSLGSGSPFARKTLVAGGSSAKLICILNLNLLVCHTLISTPHLSNTHSCHSRGFGVLGSVSYTHLTLPTNREV